jgi:hypothetical protein
MARTFADIEQEILALSRRDQLRLMRALLDEVEALPDAMSPRVLRAEIAIDLAGANAYVERYGSFAEMAREQSATDDDPV